ncbi:MULTISPECIES: flagellar hook-length control protein FliK [unclassified Bacillus (in: firmicutes)]|uniref:flagellar hook-length control protein FliK n=1 Tax=unclassified Bacillus (in: firmicutes) TaxID=185979 RepID=UPI0008E414EF|nr:MULTISPECIES: flagellar hook-length control protein FliK [unclassified Bacillus (in: firmicutes)]SFA74023.1 flagellar hook-length control protein FliK [Bacillus sp. UNCCL13]SFQ64252.1 flagellar hook-length control protein FliK [Bacillus sp. cl95]
MEIGVKNMPQANATPVQNVNSTNSTSKKGFFQLFVNTMSTAQSTQNVNGQESASANFSDADLKKLLEFMKTLDVLELEGGKEMLDQVLSNPELDIMSMVKDLLGVDESEWTQLLGKLGELMPQSLTETEDGKKDEIAQLELLMSSLLTLPKNELQKYMKDAETMIKAVKLYELLSANQESFNRETKLSDTLKQLNEKLERLLTDKGSQVKFDYLQKTVMPLAAELNNSASKVNDKESVKNLINKLDGFHQMNILPQHFSKTEQLTLMLDGGRRQISGEQLMQQFESILSRSSFLKTGGSQRLFINLNPEHLGSLRIELIQKDQLMIARILTTTGAAKETLENQLHSLKQAFAAQNIQMDRVEISQQMTQQERSFYREQTNSQEQPDQNDRREELDKQRSNNEDFINTFEEALLNAEV